MSVVYLPCINWKVQPERVLIVGHAESIRQQIQSPKSWLMTQLSPHKPSSSSDRTKPSAMTRVSGRLSLHKRRVSRPRANFMEWTADIEDLFRVSNARTSSPIAVLGELERGNKRAKVGKAGEHIESNLSSGRSQSNSDPSSSSGCFSGITSGAISSSWKGPPPHPVMDNEILFDMVQNLQPSLYLPDSVEGFFRYSDGRSLRLMIGAMPTAPCSRHNSPARPDIITDLVKHSSVRGIGHLVVLLVLEEETDAFAAGCAVARAFPLYTHTTGEKVVPCGVVSGVEAISTSASVKKAGVAAVSAVASVVMSKGITNGASVEDEIDVLLHASAAIQLAGRLVDAPPSELHVDAFVEEARAVAAGLNKLTNVHGNSIGHVDGNQVTVRVIRGDELKERGMGGLYGVGKSAIHPAALVVLSYDPQRTTMDKEESQPRRGGVALVGMGITCNTGGFALKGKHNMSGTKRDMGGAAAVLGAFEAAVHCADEFCPDKEESGQQSSPLHAILCLAENDIGPTCLKNDDIVQMYSGKLVEVKNTADNGRLVQGDGVAYAACDLKADIIVSMATVTRARATTTGRFVGTVYTNDEKLEQDAVMAGKLSGDLVHPLAYLPEFHRLELKSSVADMKNSAKNSSNAESFCEADFIGEQLPDEFFQKDSKRWWMHVDMGSPAYDEDDRASGYGVAFLLEFLRRVGRKECS